MKKKGQGGFRAWAGRPGREIKVEDCLRLGISALTQQGVFSRPWNGSWVWRENSTSSIRSMVNIQSSETVLNLSFTSFLGAHVKQSILLAKIPNTFGGYRLFFSCPVCAERRRFIYLRSGLFLCRKCQDLRYQSQSEDLMTRLWRAQTKIESNLVAGNKKPKGMHLLTFERLRSKIVELEMQRDQVMFAAIQSEFEDWSRQEITGVVNSYR